MRKTAVETDHGLARSGEADWTRPRREVVVGKANVEVVKSRIDDATLVTAPFTDACSIAWPNPARSSAAGGKVLTLVNLQDVYMEIYPPAEQAMWLTPPDPEELTWAVPATTTVPNPTESTRFPQ